MKKLMSVAMVCAVAIVAGQAASAAVVGDTNWADGVHAYTSNIQNYGGTLMSPATEFWLIGPPDADANGNNYAWDSGDPDYVAGWRSSAPDEYIVMEWFLGIPDVPGDDLVIRYYAGPGAAANVLASVDGVSFKAIGTIPSGTPGYLVDAAFDFAGLFSGGVHYVKLERTASGPQTGLFFDAFGGVVPEPATISLLGCGSVLLMRRRRRK